MAILAFQKPDKVLMLEADSKFGKFEFRPLEPGFGITVGNALRRILLSSLEGYAINTIHIEGVEHEFATVPGVKEDVTNIILNLKQVRFKQIVEEFENEKVSITVENSTEFKAGDIGKYLTGFEVLNPELVICHLDSKATMQIDLTINKGRGYVPADENREYCTDVNVIPIDSIYTPIRNVKYAVENYRVEQKTDYEKLVLEITTDGSIHPKEAGKEAEVLSVDTVTADSLNDDTVYALGCPAMGAEVLEESEMEPFVTELEANVSGKNIGLFGSYGWGDGQWMRDWVERMKSAGANVVTGEGIICNDAPDDEAVENCKNLGKELAALS